MKLVDLDKLHTAVWIYDIDNFCIVWANNAGLKFWSSPDVDALKQRDFRQGASDAVKQALLDYQTAFEQGQVFKENWHFTPNDREVSALCYLSGITLDDGRQAMLVEAVSIDDKPENGYFIDSVIISTFSISGEFLSGNPSFHKEHGDHVPALGQLFVDTHELGKMLSTIDKKNEYEGDVQFRTKLGDQWYRLNVKASLNTDNEKVLLLHQHNINERKLQELSLEKLALTDPLTQLINRRGINKSIQELIDLDSNQENRFTLLYIDLDGFKVVNDKYGHSVGDLLLVEIAEKINRLLGEQAQLARYGGDEFILLLKGTCCDQQLTVLCDEIMQVLTSPLDSIYGASLSASIGSVCFPTDAQTIDELIQLADAAMYKAKKAGKQQYVRHQADE
ncbi:GGDEF domain-containing protein [Vibrio sinaloensis]|uniref:GGDEF domain-containing protein n=1 Tax=Photobacterium sp. (strain ATCC 43367) TaxID=379097 RepID=UPI0035EEFB0D